MCTSKESSIELNTLGCLSSRNDGQLHGSEPVSLSDTGLQDYGSVMELVVFYDVLQTCRDIVSGGHRVEYMTVYGGYELLSDIG